MSNWDTVGSVINDAAVELGLISADIPDPFGSADPSIVQLLRHLKSLGQDLARDYQWTHLQKQYGFATQVGVDTYELPPDYQRFINQTGWNRTRQMKLAGPLSPQAWQQMQVMTSGGIVDVMYRIVGNELKLFPAPSAGDSVSYEYISSNWVASGGQETPNSAEPMMTGDTLWFDRRLLVCGLKLRWLRAKGFDSTAAQDDYDRALARAQGGDGVAPVLNLNVQPFSGNRVLDAANLPDTGLGT